MKKKASKNEKSSKKALKFQNVKEDVEQDPKHCGWLEVTYSCKIPLNDSENMPTGCNPKCHARMMILRASEKRAQENARFYA